MLRSVSQPSLGTIRTLPLIDGVSNITKPSTKNKRESFGQCLWDGKIGIITKSIAMWPWLTWWQGYHLAATNTFIDVTMMLSELVFILDVFLSALHQFWPVLRLHVRVYRQNLLLLMYDVISILPFCLIGRYCEWSTVDLVGRWLIIGRIYRLFRLFHTLNNMMRTARLTSYFLENMILLALFLHGFTCIWYSLNISYMETKEWYDLGYPSYISEKKLKFDNYQSCWYYCSCHVLNCVFGDCFPLARSQKWFTIFMMLFGYVFIRYQFIGTVVWEMISERRRWATFIEQYHHVTNYLKIRGAPSSLIEQAQVYKKHLWFMKDGVRSTEYLNRFPLALQMELIFDLNVGHFHDSLLLRDTDEAFMRHISLLMKHELYMSGENVWSQGVVKGGMICIKRGVLEMLSEEDDESPMISFQEGTVLGELSLFYSIPSKVTVKAATYVELQVLQRTDFMQAMSEYPQTLLDIRAKIEKRLNSSKSKEYAIRRHNKNDSRLLRTQYRAMKTLKDKLTGVEEEDSAFVDDSHMYYKDQKNVKHPKFTTDYLELYKISKNVSSFDTPRICLRATFPWILEPDTALTYMFDLCHFATVIYVCVMSPQTAINGVRREWQKVFDWVVYTALLLNIYVQLTTAIVHKYVRKETVMEIANEKMATIGFYLDILSIFPLSIFTDALDPDKEMFITQIVLLLPILQVWHIWDYINRCQNSFDRNINNLKVLCLLKFGIIFVIFCYWSGCFLYIVACPKKICQENSWMALIIYWETKVFLTNDPKHERPLLSSMSFGTSIFSGSGASGIAPGYRDFYVVEILLLLGMYLACLYTAKICSLYFLSTQRKLAFKESMRELFYFLSINHVSAKIKARVVKFFYVQWYYNQAVSFDDIFKNMSPNIQREILSLEMIETLLLCPLFQNCNRDFLQTVATNTRTIVLPDSEIIQHACDIGRDMYIVKMGHCNNLDHTGKIVSCFGPGSVFGVIEMLYGLPKVHTVVTTTNCILLHLEYRALVQSWSMFPNISQPLNKVLADPEIYRKAMLYENGKPLVGQIDTKRNRIAQEIKESFVVVNPNEFVEAFEPMGILKYIMYFFFRGSITPHGFFLKCWCLLRFISAVYYIIIIPYNIATKQSKNGGGYNWCDLFLYVDIVIMSYVAYYNDKSLLVTHPLLTVTKYLRHGFLLDLISVFPIEEFCKIVTEHSDTDLYRVNRILLVTRIIGAIMYWESDIMRLNQIVILCKFLPVAMVIVNVVTSYIFCGSCRSYGVIDNMIVVNCTRSLIVTSRANELIPAYVEYINTFYWTFELFVGCGCTITSVGNIGDMYMTMCLQITGLLYFAFMFGYIASTRSAASQALLEHNEKTQDLYNFLYQENVDAVLTMKTLNYFKYVWKRTRGSDPQKFCRGFHSALMEDTLVFMYERALREVPLFGKVERSFIRVITQHLHEMYFLKGDTVVQCKDIQSYIYIIYTGKVDVLSSYNEMLTCMGPGGMFGNFTGKPLSCSEVAIYASRNLDLLVIPTQTFFNLIKYYPKVQELLNKALEMSKDYILPITMDNFDETSEEDIDLDAASEDSDFEYKSASGIYLAPGTILSSSQSRSNVSQAISFSSVFTFQSYMSNINLIRPGSRLFQTHGYLTCIMATFSYVLLSYEMVTLNDCYIIFWIQAVFDVFFYLKIYLAMHEAYTNKRGNFIIDPSRCRRRYFKHKLWVWSDLIANFPLELFGFCFPKPLIAVHYFRANKLLRIKYLIQFYRTSSKELTNNLTLLQTIMTMLVVIIGIHTLACTWLLLSIATDAYCTVRVLKAQIVDIEYSDQIWDYVTSLYIVVAELTTTGGDEFIMRARYTMILLAICFISGKIFAGIVVATSMQISHYIKYALNAYERVTAEVIDFLKNQGLSGYQSNKLWKYIQMLWVAERGRQLPELIKKTPYVLRCDLMSALFAHHLRSCYLFANASVPFLRQLTVLLEYNVFFPGNYIVVAGDSEARMYWVASGVVSVVSVRADLTETTHELLHTGDAFGVLQGLSKGVRHYFSYRAESKVGIISLSLDSWMNILPFFPDESRSISLRSQILFSRI